MAKKTVTSKKRVVVVEANGMAHVHSSFNNIIVTLTNMNGEVISWSSAGKKGFRGSKKNTPYAAQVASEVAGRAAMEQAGAARAAQAAAEAAWRAVTAPAAKAY